MVVFHGFLVCFPEGKCHWNHPSAEASSVGSPPHALSGRPLGHPEPLPPVKVDIVREKSILGDQKFPVGWIQKVVFLLLGDVGFKVERIYIYGSIYVG